MHPSICSVKYKASCNNLNHQLIVSRIYQLWGKQFCCIHNHPLLPMIKKNNEQVFISYLYCGKCSFSLCKCYNFCFCFNNLYHKIPLIYSYSYLHCLIYTHLLILIYTYLSILIYVLFILLYEFDKIDKIWEI